MSKKIFYIIVLFLSVSFSARVEAKPVDKAVAANIASNVLKKAVVDATPQQFTECYLSCFPRFSAVIL